MRGLSVVVLLPIAVTAAGCGATPSSNEAAGTAPTATVPPPPEGEYTPWDVEILEPSLTSDSVPLVRQLAAFKRPQRSADVFVPEGDVMDPCTDCDEGRRLPSNSRLLESDLGADRLSLFGVPTDRGWVCTYLVDRSGWEGEGGTCEPGLLNGVGFEMSGDDSMYWLYGLVGDDVRRMSLVAAGRRHRLTVAGNGLFFEAKPSSICPVDIELLVVEKTDGSTREVDFKRRAPGLERAPRHVFGCRP